MAELQQAKRNDLMKTCPKLFYIAADTDNVAYKIRWVPTIEQTIVSSITSVMTVPNGQQSQHLDCNIPVHYIGPFKPAIQGYMHSTVALTGSNQW